MHNFILGPVDTDSISICKQEMAPFTEQEQKDLLVELNSLLPEHIKMAHDGYYSAVLIVKTKNYVLRYFDGRVKIKGSALKGTTKCKALQEFIRKVINLLLDDKPNEVVALYHEYIKEVMNLKDITRWTSKKTITEKVLNPERTNEEKVLDCLEGNEDQYQEGDKIRTYFTTDSKLCLEENWNAEAPNHDPYKMMESIWKTVQVFSTVIDGKAFEKYHLKTKRKLLNNLM